jgi:lipoate-protein ligase A
MSESWRFLDLKEADAYTNMAVDEALAYARVEGRAPNTLRFYMWEPSTVVVGYFQSVEDEVDIEACRRHGIDIIRRISGGGAVLNSSDGVFTYSIIIPEDDPLVSKDVTESYRFLCHGIVEGLGLLDIKAEFKPINDIIVRGKKISGNAQIRKRGVVLHHGTVLIDFDPKLMLEVLKISKEKMSDKMIKQAEERVTTVRRELWREVSIEEASKALYEGFRRSLGVELVPGELSDYEMELVERFREKYASPEWIYRR